MKEILKNAKLTIIHTAYSGYVKPVIYLPNGYELSYDKSLVEQLQNLQEGVNMQHFTFDKNSYVSARFIERLLGADIGFTVTIGTYTIIVSVKDFQETAFDFYVEMTRG